MNQRILDYFNRAAMGDLWIVDAIIAAFAISLCGGIMWAVIRAALWLGRHALP
jgi:hypothetical protein